MTGHPAPAAAPAAGPPPPRRRWRAWPHSLAGRTALVLLVALTVVQAAGLTIHALDRVDLQRLTQAREISLRAISAWRTVMIAPPDRRAQMLAELELPQGLTATLDDLPLARPEHPPMPPPMLRLLRLDLFIAGPPRFRPREIITGAVPGEPSFLASLRLPSGEWLNLHIHLPPPRPWHSETFLIAFAAMTLAAGLLILWAVRRLTRPVRALAQAADQLGRDVNAPPLPETGPSELATAAHAFNTMAQRIRAFVGERTQMLAAIGHDLRTPITRLRLRAEFMEDDEQRRKMLADLDEMEAMVTATLAFARDDAGREPTAPVDLAALCRTVLDEAADAHPDLTDRIAYRGPDRLTAPVRPVALKRAIANLVGNALAYGSAARLILQAPEAPGRTIRLAIEDDGPGIAPESLEAVFEPFRRLEGSRNRETGGTGLGLTIARDILRAHGGTLVLRNRPQGGLAALATLPG
ncbi:ATP-binding protein [Paracraurococcus ruber]|uniref:histidine kinase n=1 Tax=Paracraurococcus ruber TaxID=77675 RepID=A0ABS1D9A6_9PROT|nr:ATP-binding protein [Paracraurococcus ruber]MBK1662464.1 two-component sensor histidine kinase [Paracraurococcus ruber]TDG29716.1 HAMP domain-containing protein [Paracraurococcus ruber]